MKITIAVDTSSHAVSPLFALGAGAAGAADAAPSGAGAASATRAVAGTTASLGAVVSATVGINANSATPHAAVRATASRRSFQVLTLGFFMSVVLGVVTGRRRR